MHPTITHHVSSQDTAAPSQTRVTASFTPTANALLVVLVSAIRDNHTTAYSWQAPVGSANSLTFTQRISPVEQDPTGFGSLFRTSATVYTAPVGASPSAMTLTIDAFSGTQQAYYSVQVFSVSGYDVSSPLPQVVVSNSVNPGATDTQAQTVTLGSAPRWGNLVIGMFCPLINSSSAPTTPTGFSVVSAPAGVGARTCVYSRSDTTATAITTSDLGQQVVSSVAFAMEIKHEFNIAPTNVGASDDFAEASTSWTANFGFTATAGRLLTLTVANRSTDPASAVNTPSGWTAVLNTLEGGGVSPRLQTFWMRAAGGETSVALTKTTSIGYFEALIEEWPVTQVPLANDVSTATGGAGTDVTTRSAATPTTAAEVFAFSAIAIREGSTSSALVASGEAWWAREPRRMAAPSTMLMATAAELVTTAEVETGTWTWTTANRAVVHTYSVRLGNLGSSAITLDSFTTSGTGSLDFIGSSALTLDNFSVSATGLVEFTGSAAITLDDFVVDADGDVTDVIDGTAAITLDDFTVNATGSQEFVGTAAITLDDFAVNGSGGQEFTGTAAITLDDFSVTADGSQLFTGTVAITLDDFIVDADGVQEFIGQASITLDDFVTSGTGSQEFIASASITLDDFVVDADGEMDSEDVVGSVAITLDDFVVAADGEVENPDIEGTVAITLDDFATNASGALEFTGTVAITLDDFVVSAQGLLEFIGSSAVVLNGFDVDADGQLEFVGASAITLGNFTVVSSGSVGAVEGRPRVWIGTFVRRPAKRWNGSAWVDRTVRVYNGTSWEIID